MFFARKSLFQMEILGDLMICLKSFMDRGTNGGNVLGLNTTTATDNACAQLHPNRYKDIKTWTGLQTSPLSFLQIEGLPSITVHDQGWLFHVFFE